MQTLAVSQMESVIAKSLSPDALLEIIVSRLEDDKAEDVVSIPLAGKSDIADYMVIATGRSTTHVKSMADHVQRALKNAGYPPLSVAGESMGDWVAVDAFDVVLHIQRPEVRDFYQIEKMWQGDFGEAQLVEVA